MSSQNPSNSSLRFIVAGVAIALVLGVALLIFGGERERTAVRAPADSGEALVGGPFTLTDHTGRVVTEKDFLGKYLLVYFGFTYCPDVCPTGLQDISQAMELLGDDAEAVQPVFITVDPERDDAATMATYVSHFHPRLLGLTGTPEQIKQVASAYRVYYAKVADESLTSGYTVDHSSVIFLMGPDGKYVTFFSHGTSPEDMAKAISDAVNG